MQELILLFAPIYPATMILGLYLGFRYKWDEAVNHLSGRWVDVPVAFGLTLSTGFLAALPHWQWYSSPMGPEDDQTLFGFLSLLGALLVTYLSSLAGQQCCIFLRRRMLHK